MRPSRRRRVMVRTSRLESFESRLVMSGYPAGDFCLDYVVESQLGEEIQTLPANAHDLTGLDQARAAYGFTGGGQTVAVIDSGIAYNHLALGGGLGAGYRVVGGFDFTEELDADPFDDGPYGSHGTHVAGIIGSSDGAATGVAPGVDLVALRVFNDDGLGSFDWVQDALQWVHDNRNSFASPITTVNLSLGTRWNSDTLPSWAMLEDEFAQLEADGIFIAVAAGNGFTTYGQPGLSYPAASSYVVPVSAVDGDGSLSYFSQRHSRAIAAPGRGVLSTVPDYVGNQNGLDDDFARYSGTSMAAPYVAGASVLLRQAYEFAGRQSVAQDTIYDLMVNTADTVFDPITGQSYHRLNVLEALEAIMPEDDFGSTAGAAHSLGTLADAHALGGTIGRLDDLDYFTFTAGQTGTVSFTAEATWDLVPDWQLVGSAATAAMEENVFSFDVVGGQSYTVKLGTQDGLGHYCLDVGLEPDFSAIDWGTIAQEQFLDNRITAEGQWFSLTAGRDGLLTVEAFFADAGGNVDLEVFDAEGQLLGGSYSTDNLERIDVEAEAGETFYLRAFVDGAGVNNDVDFRVTNLVSQDGGAVNVVGTDGDDVFTFTAGSVHQVSINGVSYQFDGGQVAEVSFNGLAGSDTAVLYGTHDSETAVLRVGSAELSSSAYHVGVVSSEAITVHGGGGFDRVSMFDSAGNDTFVASPGQADLYGGGFHNRVEEFEAIHAYAKAGGSDTAHLYDSAGNDVFVGRPLFGKMYGQGFLSRAKFFDVVNAYSTAGGQDVAYLRDSAGNDTFVATPTYGKISGAGFLHYARLFEKVHALAGAGGYDTAYLYDSAGNDTFIATADDSRLYGSGFFNRARGFNAAYAYATAGGSDVAHLHDSALDDHFQGAGSWGRMSNVRLSTWVYGFDRVHLYGDLGGSNTTELTAVDYILELLGRWEG